MAARLLRPLLGKVEYYISIIKQYIKEYIKESHLS